jgi:hypothetical protein
MVPNKPPVLERQRPIEPRWYQRAVASKIFAGNHKMMPP